MKVSRIQADLLLVGAAFIWGSAFLVQTAAGKFGLAFLFNAVCFFLAAVALLPLAWPYRMVAGQLKWMCVAGFFLFGGSAAQQYGLYYTKVANAGFLTVLNVVFVPLLLWLAFRERPRLSDWAAVGMATLGAFLLSTNGVGLAWQPGDALELLGAVFWALHIVLIAKVGGRFPSIPFAIGQFFVCALLNLAVGIATENPTPLLERSVIAGALYRGLLSIGVGYTMQVWVQKFTPPTDAVLIFSLESVFAALCAWLWLSETLAPVQMAGCGLILVAAFFPQLLRGSH